MNTIYNEDFYNGLKLGSYTSAQVIVPIVINQIGKINSVVDFGCGTGAWLNVFFNNGVEEIMGLDFGDNASNLLIDKNQYSVADLSQMIDLGRKYDLCISLEVAEHISADYSDIFIDNLCRHSDIVLFSAANIKQGGCGHLNEQKLSYWINKFKARGFTCVDSIRSQIWTNENVEYWYKQNIVLFVKDKIIDCINVDENLKINVVDVIHPDAIETSVNYYETRLINLGFLRDKLPLLHKIYRKIIRR